MAQPTATAYPDAWHAAEEVDERSWLDQWARLHLTSATPEPATNTTSGQLLTPAGSR